jgi:hypothetical protein
MKRRSCSAVLRMLVLLSSATAQADATLKLSGFGQYEYTSNVFDLPPGLEIQGGDASHRGDSYYSYNGDLELSQRLRLQDWYFGLHGAEVKYDRFTQLTHDEYWLKGGWRWQFQSRLRGTLEVQRTQAMVPFTQLTQLQMQLSINTEQREAASLSYRIASTWSLEGYGYTRTTTQPLPTAPELRLNESQVATTLRYSGGSGPAGSGLTFGVNAAYLHGEYAHTNGTFNPGYDQKSASLLASYVPSGRATINGTVGYSSRESPAISDSVSGLTGRLSYSHEITGKTSLDIVINRSIASYLANSGSQIDSSAGVGLNWRATYKIALSACYLWTYSDFPAQGATTGSNRIDHFQYTSTKLEYAPQDWLVFRPYANWQTRTSDYAAARFHAATYGAQLVFQWQFPPLNRAGRGGTAASTTCNTPLPL